jgi:hypothetical protein
MQNNNNTRIVHSLIEAAGELQTYPRREGFLHVAGVTFSVRLQKCGFLEVDGNVPHAPFERELEIAVSRGAQVLKETSCIQH